VAQFGKRIFWAWVVNAIYHSIIIYVFGALIFWDDLTLNPGWIGGHWIWGTTIYMVVVVTVLAKAAIVSEYVVVSLLVRLTRLGLFD
jgi:phospholipid-transporting ATPase